VREREATINVAAELQRLKALVEIIATPGVRKRGLSEVDMERVQRQSEDVAKAFGLERVPAAEEVFSPAFLPPRTDRAL
jgi:NitT/TauT family transport system substrate-binding protein